MQSSLSGWISLTAVWDSFNPANLCESHDSACVNNQTLLATDSRTPANACHCSLSTSNKNNLECVSNARDSYQRTDQTLADVKTSTVVRCSTENQTEEMGDNVDANCSKCLCNSVSKFNAGHGNVDDEETARSLAIRLDSLNCRAVNRSEIGYGGGLKSDGTVNSPTEQVATQNVQKTTRLERWETVSTGAGLGKQTVREGNFVNQPPLSDLQSRSHVSNTAWHLTFDLLQIKQVLEQLLTVPQFANLQHNAPVPRQLLKLLQQWRGPLC